MRNKMAKKKGLLAGILLLMTVNTCAADWLFRNGKSNYQIVVSEQASTSEQTAARELQQYIRLVSGVQLSVTSNLKPNGSGIYIGYNNHVAALTGAEKPEKDDESFTYRTIGHDLLSGAARSVELCMAFLHSLNVSWVSIGLLPSVP